MSDGDAQKIVEAAIRLVQQWKEDSLDTAVASAD